jgi:tryptophan halogenase
METPPLNPDTLRNSSLYSEEEVLEFLGNVESTISKCVDVMPRHADYIAQHCAAVRM